MRPVVGVFAHPDDEIFISGTLATFAKKRDVYLVSVTNGEAGINSSNKALELGALRQEELRASAKILGVKDVIFLSFPDGELGNNLYGSVARKLHKTIAKLDPELLLTFDPRGVSGHLDHVFTSMITSYVFQKLSNVSELWYYCFDQAEYKRFKKYYQDYFVYIPPGYKDTDISKTIDAAPVWDQKIKSMQQHESQKHDIAKLIEIFTKQKEEYFIILNKDTV